MLEEWRLGVRTDHRGRCSDLPCRAAGRWRRGCRKQAAGVPWPSQGPLHALLRRDVGALLLLRHASAAGLLPDQALAVRRRQGEPHLRRLRKPRLHHAGPRRLSCRPLSRAAQGGPVRRRSPDLRPLHDGVRRLGRPVRPDHQHLLDGAGLHHRRIGLPQGQHLGDGRTALQPHRRSPGRGLHHLLHGH